MLPKSLVGKRGVLLHIQQSVRLLCSQTRTLSLWMTACRPSFFVLSIKQGKLVCLHAQPFYAHCLDACRLKWHKWHKRAVCKPEAKGITERSKSISCRKWSNPRNWVCVDCIKSTHFFKSLSCFFFSIGNIHFLVPACNIIQIIKFSMYLHNQFLLYINIVYMTLQLLVLYIEGNC